MIRLFLKTFGLLIATLLVSFYVQVQILDRMMEESRATANVDFRERFRPTFYFVERELLPFPDESWVARLDRHQPGFTYPMRIEPLARLKGLQDDAAWQARLAEGRIVSLDASPTMLNIIKRLGQSDYGLVLAFPMAASLRNEVNAMNLIVESLFVALFVWLLIVFFWRDMMKLNRAAEAVGQGSFDFHVDLPKRAALRPLADSFNAMKDRIAALLSSHRNLTNAISHEFRTPITRLRFRHELAIDAATLAEKDDQLRAMSTAIDQLDDLATELLEYARLDRESPALELAPFDAGTWLQELAEEARDVARAEGRGVTISVKADADSIAGDYRYLSRAAANLLRNAVRYARQRVELRFETLDGKSALHVDDDGPGIPLAEREHLFEPFTRLDQSRDRQSGGFGIGLAIVRQIARWHGGTASIAESSLGGARVSIVW
jgi:signal transduction histidine kinase